MKINGKSYTIAQLREKLPLYDMWAPTKIKPGSHEANLHKKPINTTNPNLHLIHDTSKVVKRGDQEIADRRYVFFGLIGTKAYSMVEKYFHDDSSDDQESENP